MMEDRGRRRGGPGGGGRGACRVSDDPWGRRGDVEGSGGARGGVADAGVEPKKAHLSARTAMALPAERLAGRPTG
jgi:hypothetical protein